eukprot:jgi/Tetstr1/458628/TSEL_045031.t1
MGKSGEVRRNRPGSAPPLDVVGKRGYANVYTPLGDVEVTPADSPTEEEAKDDMMDSMHGGAGTLWSLQAMEHTVRADVWDVSKKQARVYVELEFRSYDYDSKLLDLTSQLERAPTTNRV